MVTACPITSIDSELLASVEVRKRRTVMTWGKRLGITSRFVFTTAAALALALTLVAPVRADHFNHVRSWSGTLAGSIIGGAIGSTIGQGRGRLVAVGAGALLGGLYGRHLARDHRHLRAHHHSWHGHRGHHHPWHVHHRAWQRLHARDLPASTPRPWTVLHSPAHVPGPATVADYVLVGTGSAAPRGYYAALTECRIFEDGLAPVYMCRSEDGDWHILR